VDVVTLRQAPPALHRPVLVSAFRGWNDAGESATGAISALGGALGAKAYGEIDPEEFFDFQSTRPQVRFDGDGERAVEWPSLTLSWAQLPAHPTTGEKRHVVLLEGSEPNLRWRTFSDGIRTHLQSLGVELAITLGALQVDVPHTRPVPITGSSTKAELGARLGLRRSRYEGPTGITGVMGASLSKAHLDVVSFWAGVPHYLAAAVYLSGSLALAERTLSLLEVDLPLEGLARDAAGQRDEIAALVAEDDDLADYVGELEEQLDEADQVPDIPDIPQVSGDELAAELERYLRDRGPGA